MKIDFGAPFDEPKNLNMRMQRMEVLLRQWYVPPSWRRHPHPNDPSPPQASLLLTEAELAVWQRVIEVAEIIRPMTTLSGVRTFIELHNLVHPDTPWNEEELVAQGRLKIVGDRAV